MYCERCERIKDWYDRNQFKLFLIFVAIVAVITIGRTIMQTREANAKAKYRIYTQDNPPYRCLSYEYEGEKLTMVLTNGVKCTVLKPTNVRIMEK